MAGLQRSLSTENSRHVHFPLFFRQLATWRIRLTRWADRDQWADRVDNVQEDPHR